MKIMVKRSRPFIAHLNLPAKYKIILNIFSFCATFMLILNYSLAFAQDSKTDCDETISITPTIPSEIRKCPEKNTLINAAEFAWKEFIALNWPAKSDLIFKREVPDESLHFGEGAANPNNTTPLVWETFRHKVEIFPAHANTKPTSSSPQPQGYDPNVLTRMGYDAYPKYIYDVGPKSTPMGIPSSIEIPSCQKNVSATLSDKPNEQISTSWVNLDEMSELGLVSVHAGGNTVSAGNSDKSLIRFLAKANFVEYSYVVNNSFWYESEKLTLYQNNYKYFVLGVPLPDSDYFMKHTVQFPSGTIEVKSAWRPLTSVEAKSGRFHQLPVRYYEKINNSVCYYQETWGMIALHIIQKTPDYPEFVFATFEQADNILNKDGKYVEDDDGKCVQYKDGKYVEVADCNILSNGVTEPVEHYEDAPEDKEDPEDKGGPIVSIVPPLSYCNRINEDKRLYFKEANKFPGFPNAGFICVNRRSHPIEKDVISVNKKVHSLLSEYASRNKLNENYDMPFSHYKLVSVQAGPLDKKDIGKAGVSKSTYYQANIVVETDYTLQNFSGRLTQKKGPQTDYPEPQQGYPEIGNLPNFKNVHHYVPESNNIAAHFDVYNSGGCQGCHGNAQLKGNDFSFLIDGNKFSSPETPEDAPENNALRKY